jgi:hypothetical protein
MIDWPGFLRAWDQNLREAEAKKLTVEFALEQIKLGGKLGGKTEEAARKDVLKMLGLQEPTVTFESEFPEATSTDPFMNAVFEQMKNPNSPIAVMLQAYVKGPEVTAPQTKPAEKMQATSGKAAQVVAGLYPEPVSITPATMPVDLMDSAAKVGVDTAGKLYTSYASAIKEQNVGLLTSGYWGQSLTSKESLAELEAAGKAGGVAAGNGFLAGVRQAAGPVRSELASMLFGGWMDEMDRRYLRRGAVQQ